MLERVFLDWCLSCFFCAIAGSTFPKSFSVGELDHRRPESHARYGFLDIRELAKCVRETGAAASIAFIPWNHRRTAREVVSLFKQGWPQLSICVHGCDHTGSEFSTKTVSAAMPLVDLAYRRMAQLERETSLGFDRVMVFPQGRFSAEAMRALRASPMLSAVNTELVDCQTGTGVKGHELLETGDYVVWRFSFVYETPGGRGIRKFCAGSAAREALSYRYPSSVFRRWIEATSCCRGSLECTPARHDLD